MFFVSLLSFSAGYFLNEEKSLTRLCKNLGYAHEGWFILHEQKGFFIYFVLMFWSFLKSWFWSVVLQSSFSFWYFPIGMYLGGNFVARSAERKFHFTFWCTWAGMLLALNKVLFQISLTAVVVYYVLRKEKNYSLRIWKIVLGGLYIFQEIVTF